jgi:hypothetical protein
MSDENDESIESMIAALEAGDATPTPAPKPAPEAPARTAASASAGASESGTRAMLRDAIQQVIDEIDRHECEAKRHLEQAQELRKELRESVAFLQSGGQAGKPAEAPKAAEHAGKTRARDGDKTPRGAAGKKGPAGKRK